MIEVRLDTDPATLETLYYVVSDNMVFCATRNDEDGFKLLVAVNELEYRRQAEREIEISR